MPVAKRNGRGIKSPHSVEDKNGGQNSYIVMSVPERVAGSRPRVPVREAR